LACGCGQKVLVKGYRPDRLISVSIRCGNCGAVTTTPDLPAGSVLSGTILALDRSAREMPVSGEIAAGVTFVDRAALERTEAPLRPRRPETAPMTLTASLLREVIEAYDALSDGAYAVHAEASRPLHWTGVRRYPLAWSCLHLQAWLASPIQPLLGPVETTAAAVHLAAFRQFLGVWGHHPLFRDMAACAAATGFALHELAVFTAPALLFEAGNRAGLRQPNGSARIREWSLQTADGLLGVETVAFPRFAWPDGKPWTAAAIRSSLQEAISAARGRINPRNPGILVLSAGLVPEIFDARLQEGIHRLFRASGRTNRGLAAMAMIAPRVIPADGPDRFGFGWLFGPIANPAFVSGPRESA
jgi:hypothetical protein